MPHLIAFVQIPAGTCIPLLCERADALGAHVTRESNGTSIKANSGGITARPVTGGDGGLQMLRGAIDGFVKQTGTPAVASRSAAAEVDGKSRLSAARLLSRTRILPSSYPIRLTGDFSALTQGGLHLRLLIDPEGASLPAANTNGIHWPGGIEVWHRPIPCARSAPKVTGSITTSSCIMAGGSQNGARN